MCLYAYIHICIYISTSNIYMHVYVHAESKDNIVKVKSSTIQ